MQSCQNQDLHHAHVESRMAMRTKANSPSRAIEPRARHQNSARLPPFGRPRTSIIRDLIAFLTVHLSPTSIRPCSKRRSRTTRTRRRSAPLRGGRSSPRSSRSIRHCKRASLTKLPSPPDLWPASSARRTWGASSCPMACGPRTLRLVEAWRGYVRVLVRVRADVQTMYISPDGDPLWMSFGRGSKELVPTCRSTQSLPKLMSSVSSRPPPQWRQPVPSARAPISPPTTFVVRRCTLPPSRAASGQAMAIAQRRLWHCRDLRCPRH